MKRAALFVVLGALVLGAPASFAQELNSLPPGGGGGEAAPVCANLVGPVLNAGWCYDEVTVVGAQSTASIYAIPDPGVLGAMFRITDGFLAGDIYEVIVDGVALPVPPSFTTVAWTGVALPASDVIADAAWVNIWFHGGEVFLAGGVAHTVKVIGNIIRGVPAGFYVRLDAGNAVKGAPSDLSGFVPALSSWGILIFALLAMPLGWYMRQRSRRKASSFA